MEIVFEDENGEVIEMAKENIFIPNNGDLLYINHELFEVRHKLVDYDNNFIEIDIERV